MNTLNIEISIKNANQEIYDMLLAFFKTQPKVKFDIKKEERTINGFTPEFEAELLKDLEETKEAYARGERRSFRSVEEFTKAMENDEI